MFGHAPCSSPPTPRARSGRSTAPGTRARGAKGKTPPPRMRELMEKYRKAFGVPDQERTQLAKDVWKIALDELWIIPVVVELARLAGRAGHQDQHGQHPRAALEQRGQRQPAHRPHGDLVLQVLAGPSPSPAGWSGRRTQVNPWPSSHQPAAVSPGPASRGSSPARPRSPLPVARPGAGARSGGRPAPPTRPRRLADAHRDRVRARPRTRTESARGGPRR